MRVYLDLHGAMVTEHLDDGEGEILRARAAGDRQGFAAGGQPRSARQRDAGNGRACGRTDRLPHLSACRHGRHRPRLRRTSGAAARHRAEIRKGVPAIAVPDSDQLAVHQRPADQGHLPEARGAAGRCGADAVVCAGLSGRRFQRLRTERIRLWRDPGRMPTPRPIPSRTSLSATRTISTAASTRPTKACCMRWSWRRPRASRSSSPTPRTIPAPAAIPTPRACCARWCATTPSAPPPA